MDKPCHNSRDQFFFKISLILTNSNFLFFSRGWWSANKTYIFVNKGYGCDTNLQKWNHSVIPCWTRPKPCFKLCPPTHNPHVFNLMQKLTALRGTQPLMLKAALCPRGEEVGHGCYSSKIETIYMIDKYQRYEDIFDKVKT